MNAWDLLNSEMGLVEHDINRFGKQNDKTADGEITFQKTFFIWFNLKWMTYKRGVYFFYLLFSVLMFTQKVIVRG